MAHPAPSLRELEAHLDSRRLRQLAVGLIVFGSFGLITLVLIAVVAFRSLGSLEPLNDNLEAERRQVVTMLHDTAKAVRDASTGTTNAGTSLGQAQQSASQAATLSRSVAVTMRNIAEASQVSIFGSQPLAGMSTGFSDAAKQADEMGSTLDKTATALGSNSADISRVHTDLDQVATETDTLAAQVEAMPPFADALAGVGSLRWVFTALLIWLAVPALASLAAGAWLWRWLGAHEGLGEAAAGNGRRHRRFGRLRD